MKIYYILSLIALVFMLTIATTGKYSSGNIELSDEIEMPENVKEAVDNKCFGCHNSESQADKAKEKLMFDKLGNLTKVKMVSVMGDIEDVLNKGEMPPEKFLERFPDKKLTNEESDLIKAWAVSTAEGLLK